MASERTLSAHAGSTARTAGIILMSIVLWSLTAGQIFGDSPKNPTNAKPGKAALLAVPLSFEANQGQTDSQVKFLSHGDGYSLFLTSNEVVFTLRTPAGVKAPPSVFRMELLGAERNAQVSGADKLPGAANYFIGNDPKKWRSGISAYGKVKYRGIYLGVDAVFYGNQRQLEYDFVVAPGADPGQIALEFSGASPTLSPDGSLVLMIDGAPLTFRKPVVYQTIAGKKELIAGNYELSGERVQFSLGKYDHSRVLVIDPVLSYLTYLGGSSADIVGFTTYGGNTTQGMVVDQAGNVYVTGSTQSTDFPLQNPIQKINSTNAPTGFVAKLNPAGSQLIYSTYIGGGVFNDDTITRPYAIAVDGSGNAYLTGFTSAPQFPITAGAYQTICGTLVNNVTNCPATQSAFLTKLSPAGGLVYSTFLGHSGETGVAVAVDAKGQAYVAGNSSAYCASNGPNSCFPTTANAVLQGSAFNYTTNPSNINQGSAFISVLDAAGANLLYSSLFGGDGSPAGNEHATFGSDVAVDSSGYFYLAVTTQSNQLPVTPGAFQTTYYGNPNPGFGTSSRGFVAKFNPVSSGAALVYGTYLGGFDKTVGSYQDVISGIAADAAGNAYISGNASYDFPATAGANNSTPCPSAGSCENRGFLAKLNPAGSGLVWATFVGTVTNPTISSANTISPPRLDAAGNIYVSGIAGTNTEYPLVNPLQPANGFSGVYVTMYDPTGSTMIFSTVIYDPTGNGQIFSSGVDADSQGNIYVAGYTARTALPVTTGAFQTANAGNFDGFIAKITPTVEPALQSGTLANGATYLDGGLVPGSWAQVKGTNLSTATRIWAASDFTGLGNNLPTNLSGVQVMVNNQAAAVYYISPTQISFQVPAGITGTASVQVINNGQMSNSVTAAAATSSPGIFPVILGGTNYAAAVFLDGKIAADPSNGPGFRDAVPGDTVQLFATGLVPSPAGTVVSTTLLSGVTVTIGTVTIPAIAAALVAVGEFQINFTVPQSFATLPSGLYPISISINGVTSPASINSSPPGPVVIPIQP
jgi:uncharacterized protein (TIGR03437 family)